MYPLKKLTASTLLRTVVIVLAATSLTSCVQPWIKPYERANLADSVMSPARNAVDSGYMKHVYENREAARGADGGAGGGCGCN